MMKRPPMRTAVALLALLLPAACGESMMDPDPDGSSTIILPLRVHVLSSLDFRLSATSSDGEVRAMLDRVNQIWSAADIRFELESIVREPLIDAAILPILQAGGTITLDLFGAAIPLNQRLASGWDLFIVRDLASVAAVPGVFFSSIPAASGSEVDPAGINDPGRILAHELGHALTLPHVACPPEGNLMAPGCAGADRGRLTVEQIAAARSQAETGGPETF